MKDGKIYLDNNGTTFLDPRVAEVLIHALHSFQGNPSSVHAVGRQAKLALQKARRTLAELFNANPAELVFFSGATEGLNTLLRVLKPGDHLITSSVEHAAVYATAKALQAQGVEVTFLEPGLWGAATVPQVEQALRPHTKLIALMAVNNETGVKTDLEAVASLAFSRKIPLLVDGVAQLGKEPVTLYPGIAAYCVSGHKIHGPKGAAFAIVRKKYPFAPLLTGGEQESGRRGGTENLPAILGLEEAVRIAFAESAWEKIEALRLRFEEGILNLKGVKINGDGPRTCNTTNATFLNREGEILLAKLDLAGTYVSHGSACASGALEPSRVLLNMGIPRSEATGALRFSFSRFNTEQEVDQVLRQLQIASP